MASKKDQHVVPRSDGWAVRRSGAERASRVFANQADAVSHARNLAKEARGELYIHRRDGTIRERSSYGHDPVPPKDKR